MRLPALSGDTATPTRKRDRQMGHRVSVARFGIGITGGALFVIGAVLTGVGVAVERAWSVQEFAGLSLAACLATGVPILIKARQDPVHLPLAYCWVVLAMFHYGLCPALAFSQDIGALLGTYETMWLRDETLVRLALSTSNLFCCGFAAAALLPRPRRARRSTAAAEPSAGQGMVAFALLVILIVMWLCIVILSGKGSDYTAFNLAFGDNPVLGQLIGILHFSIAAAFYVACVNGQRAVLPLAVYIGWALVAFPLGLRGNVLLPLALTVPVLIVQGKLRVPLLPAMVGAVVLLGLIAVVANARTGALSYDQALSEASPMRGLAELGASLRPVAEVHRWHESGEAFEWGATYWAPFERTFLLFFPIAERLPGEYDTRLMNVVVQDRVGNIGFSIVAEAFVNFGRVGAVLVGALFGLGVRTAGARVATDPRSLWAPAFLFAFLFVVRQSFVSGFGAFVVFLVIPIATSTFYLLTEGRGEPGASAKATRRLGRV